MWLWRKPPISIELASGSLTKTKKSLPKKIHTYIRIEAMQWIEFILELLDPIICMSYLHQNWRKMFINRKANVRWWKWWNCIKCLGFMPMTSVCPGFINGQVSKIVRVKTRWKCQLYILCDLINEWWMHNIKMHISNIWYTITHDNIAPKQSSSNLYARKACDKLI